MHKRIILTCVLLYQVLHIQVLAHTDKCEDNIDVAEINALTISDNYYFSLTGSGTMNGTGSGTMSPCTGSGSISGSIFTQFHEPIKGVHVELNSDQDNYPISFVTDMDGEYAFTNIEEEYNYLITPSKEGDQFNGISTLDVLLLANLVFRPHREISPYTLIAADVNQDQHINIRDIIELVYLIIGGRTELEDNWVFVDADQQFIDESNPWPYTDEIAVNNLQGASINNDFIGIKLGDLSGNANPWLSQFAQQRSTQSAYLYVEDILLEKDNNYSIKFLNKDIDDIRGMQLFLSHMDLEVLDIQSGFLDTDKGAYHHSDKGLFMAWYGIANPDSEVLFTIDIETSHDGYLSDLLGNYTNWLPTEAYIGDEFDAIDLNLKFISNEGIESGFTLEQNTPNPFTDYTEIGFDLQKAGQVRLDVFDNLGQLHFQKTLIGQKGINTIRIKRGDLDNIGLYYYTLTYKGKTQTKSLLHID